MACSCRAIVTVGGSTVRGRAPWLALPSSLRMIPLSCGQLGHHFLPLGKRKGRESRRGTGTDVRQRKKKKGLENWGKEAGRQRDR